MYNFWIKVETFCFKTQSEETEQRFSLLLVSHCSDVNLLTFYNCFGDKKGDGSVWYLQMNPII